MLSDWAFRFREYHISDLIAGRPIDTSSARRFQGLQFSISKPGTCRATQSIFGILDFSWRVEQSHSLCSASCDGLLNRHPTQPSKQPLSAVRCGVCFLNIRWKRSMRCANFFLAWTGTFFLLIGWSQFLREQWQQVKTPPEASHFAFGRMIAEQPAGKFAVCSASIIAAIPRAIRARCRTTC
jgi:hypothetical protein